MKRVDYRNAVALIEIAFKRNNSSNQTTEHSDMTQVLTESLILRSSPRQASCSKKKRPLALKDNAEYEQESAASHILKKSRLEMYISIRRTQKEMFCLIDNIKLSLGFKRADVDLALKLLKDLHAIMPNITKVMLLKYPDNFYTLKRLRKYVGNVSTWNLSSTELKMFEEKALKIRDNACSICRYIKVSLTISDFT